MSMSLIQRRWRRLCVQQKIWTILLVVFVPVVVAFALHVSLITTLLALQQEGNRTADARHQILVLRRLAIDVEDAFRGYVLTRQTRFLQPMVDVEPKLARASELATAMVSKVPGMASDIKTATARLNDLVASKHALVDDVKAGRTEDVLAYVRSGKGLVLSDTVRNELRVIEDRLESRLTTLERQQATIAHRAFWGLLLALVGGVGLGLLCARLLSRSITSPLEVLQHSVRQFGLQLENAPPRLLQVGPDGHDEIAGLAGSFEDMAERIQHQIMQLEALHQTGHEINTIGPDGLDGVLRRITDRAAELLNVDVCLVLLRNDRMGCWVVEAASGDWNDRLQKTVILWEEFPVSVEAFQTARPAVGVDLRSDDHPILRRRNLRGHSMLSIPLISQGTPFGVVVLLLDCQVSRENWNVRLAKGLADEAAMAIANARLYEAAHRKEQRLESRLQQLEQLAETLAHDLKGPGERMEGLASMLLTEYGTALDARAGRWLRLIEQNGKELITRVENLLQVARVGSRADPVEAVAPAPVLQAVLNERASDLQAGRFRIHVDCDVPAVACHRAYLRQVFDNLLSNAVKFSGPVANPEVRVVAQRQGAVVSFAISDNGPGIPAEHRDHVFEPFVQLTPGTIKGSGIGLAIVKRIVELYGGRVWIEENRPTGCVVRFTLPLVADLADPGSSVQHQTATQTDLSR